MKSFRGCLMVAFIFLCGLLVGGFLGAAIGWVGFFHKIARGGPGAVAEVVMDRAAHDLKLKPEQRSHVRTILAETGEELRVATRDCVPRVEEVMGRTADRIRDELTPLQRRKFDVFATQAQHRWQAALQPHAPAATPAPSATPEPAAIQ